MTKEELHEAIVETERQEKLFRLADNLNMTAWWVLERVRLRSLLFNRLMEEIR